MNLAAKVQASIEEEIECSRNRFMQSISTDENSDYRRGFLAGELFARLHFKCAFREMLDATAEQPTS